MAVIDNSKYWGNGLPYEYLDSDGTMMYWENGVPYAGSYEEAAAPAAGGGWVWYKRRRRP